MKRGTYSLKVRPLYSLEKREWEPHFKQPKLKPLFRHRERNLDDQFYARFGDENSQSKPSILQQMISIEREAFFSKLKKDDKKEEEGFFGVSRQKQHRIPRTLGFLLHLKSIGEQIPQGRIINALLSNGLEFEASFLLNQGYTPSFSQLLTALNYEEFGFVIEFLLVFADKAYNTPSSNIVEFNKALIAHFDQNYEMIEIIIFALLQLNNNFNYQDRLQIVKLIEHKIQHAADPDHGFLLFVRNPIKICVLLIDLLKKKFNTGIFCPLKYEVEELTRSLSKIATEIEFQIKDEEMLRFSLMERDLEGRDVITIMSQNEVIELFSHPYIEKLSLQTWEGPHRSTKNPLQLSTSWIALASILKPDYALQDPIQERKSLFTIKENKEKNLKENFAFQFKVWRRGIMVRYYTALLLYFMIALFVQILLSDLFTTITDLANVVDQQFGGNQNNLTEFDGLFVFHCTNPITNTQSTDPDKIQKILQIQMSLGNDAFNSLLSALGRVICNSHKIEYTRSVTFNSALMVFLFLPLHYIILGVFFTKTKRPLKYLFCREVSFFDLALYVGLILAIFWANPRIKEQADRLDKSSPSYYFVYGTIFVDTHINEMYSVCIVAMWMRFFFSLKVTRLFGPFIKVIKINALRLVKWLIVYICSMLAATNFLLIILSQKSLNSNSGCGAYTDCFKLLLQGSVGQVDFTDMLNFKTAELFYATFVIVFMVLFLSMLIAMMTNTFNQVVRTGQLHYYKEIFDLRYLFQLDKKYSSLVSLEYPFSVIFVFYLIFLQIYELREKRNLRNRKDKLDQEYEALAQFDSTTSPQATTRGKMLRKPNQMATVSKNIYGCCYCKVKRRPEAAGLLLQELNEITLRVVYFVTILIIFLFVLCVGFILVPFGYLAMIYARFRIILLKKKSYFFNKENFQMKKGNLKSIARRECTRKCCEVLQLSFFILYGIPYLLYLNIKDSVELVHHALNSQLPSDHSVQLRDESRQFQLDEPDFLLQEDLQSIMKTCRMQRLRLSQENYEQKMKEEGEGYTEQIYKVKYQDKQSRYLENLKVFNAKLEVNQINYILLVHDKEATQSKIHFKASTRSVTSQKVDQTGKIYGRDVDIVKSGPRFKHSSVKLFRSEDSVRSFALTEHCYANQENGPKLRYKLRLSAQTRLLSLFELECTVKGEYLVPLEKVECIIKSFLHMRDITAKIERINNYGCPLLFATRNASPRLKQFNICIGNQYFDAVYQFSPNDQAELDKLGATEEMLMIRKEKHEQKKAKRKMRNISHNNSIVPLNLSLGEEEVYVEQENKRRLSRLTTKVIHESKQNKEEEEFYNKAFENFLKAETYGKCLFGVKSFGCFTLKSTHEGAVQFEQSLKGDEIIADAYSALMAYKKMT